MSVMVLKDNNHKVNELVLKKKVINIYLLVK